MRHAFGLGSLSWFIWCPSQLPVLPFGIKEGFWLTFTSTSQLQHLRKVWGENNFAFFQPCSPVLAIHSLAFCSAVPLHGWGCSLAFGWKSFLLLVAFYFCLHCGHAGGLRGSPQVSPRQIVPFASTMSIFWSFWLSPGERPLHLPSTPIPFYGQKGPLPCLLLPALVSF